MSTTTIPSPLNLKLPSLINGTMPPELAELGAPWDALLADRDHRLDQAKEARRRFDQARKAVEDAVRRDKDAALSAVEAGESVAGFEHRDTALADVERLHAEAEAATILANRTAIALRKAVDGQAGDNAITVLDERIAKARTNAVKKLDAASAALADLGTLCGVQATIPDTKRGGGLGSASVTVLRGTAKRGLAGLPTTYFNSGQRQGADAIFAALARIADSEGER